MTCIVGIAREGKVYIGGDSFSGSEYCWNLSDKSKVFNNGPFLIGCCGSWRMVDLLHYSLKVEAQSDTITDDAYMRTTFIKTVIECFKDNNWLKANDGKNQGGNFLVGYKGRLYEIQDDFSVLNCPEWGQVTGSGTYNAAGSLHTTRHHWDTKLRIIQALEAAEANNPFVRGPFYILEN